MNAHLVSSLIRAVIITYVVGLGELTHVIAYECPSPASATR